MLAAQTPAFVLDEVHRVLPPAPNAVRNVLTGDVDGDGHEDLVAWTGSGARTYTSVWRAAGNGRFLPLQDAVLVPWLPTCSLLADLDGDGDRDLVALRRADCLTGSPNCGGAVGALLWNDGTGRFASNGMVLPLDPALRTTSIAAGDVDGDGDLDLVVGCEPQTWTVSFPPAPPVFNSVRGENWLFLNQGNGTFVPTMLGSDRDATRSVLLVDLDGDGDLDLFAGNDGQDRCYRNIGLALFQPVVGALPADTGLLSSAHALDLEGDGDRDLLVLDLQQGARLLRNDGLGNFTDVSANLPNVLAPLHQVFVADFDGDGDPDIGQRGGAVLVQLRNDGTGVFTHAAAADRTAPNAATAVPIDLDGDGDRDLALPDGGYLEHSLFWNDGTGALSLVPNDLPADLGTMVSAALVDLDADGDLDVLAPAETSQNRVYRNDGAGRWTSVAFGDFTVDLGLTGDIAVGDLDGDGWPDAATANSVFPSFPVPSYVYRNDGSGRLDRLASPSLSAYTVAFGDLDGDGDLDVYWGRAGNPIAGGVYPDVVWRNLGNMVFAPIAGAVSDTAATTGVALGDVDGDGDLDAVLTAWSNVGNRVLRNDGTGMFTAAPVPLPNPTGNSRKPLLVDVDGDGDLDLLIPNDGTPNRLYRNDGTGGFTDSSVDLPQDSGRTMSFAAGDFDGDGDVDLLECNWNSAVPTRALANNGLGQFTVVPGGLPLVTDFAHRFVTGDLDGDGDVDAFLTSQGTPHVYYNRRRHFAWRELPRIGRLVTMDLWGAANDPFVFVAAPSRVLVPLPGLGTLQVDIGNPLTIEYGVLDATGRSSRSYPVPPLPVLLGLSFHWQALSGNPGVLGNLETTTLLPD